MSTSPSPKPPVTIFGPDFPFPFDDWIAHPAGLGSLPAERLGEEVAIVGAGMAGMVAAYELMKLGLKPVIYEASKMGGRLRSQVFEGTKDVVAELGGMRFPVSSTAFSGSKSAAISPFASVAAQEKESVDTIAPAWICPSSARRASRSGLFRHRLCPNCCGPHRGIPYT